jgi:hypothetical protein
VREKFYELIARLYDGKFTTLVVCEILSLYSGFSWIRAWLAVQTLDRGTVVVLDRYVRSADTTGVEHGDELLM